VLRQAQTQSKLALDSLQDLESSALDLEEQMENSEAFAAGKNKRDQRSMIEELSDLQKRVQALEDAKRYIIVLSRTQKLMSESRELLQTSTVQALIPYRSLVDLSNIVKHTVASQDTKLERYLSASVDGLLQDFKGSLSRYHLPALEVSNPAHTDVPSIP